jgi:ketosteroid isomerase-like protein
MSRENVEAFQRGADAISRGDVVDIPQLVHPDAVFEPLRSATEGPYVGHEGMRRFIADTEEMFQLFRISYTDVRDLGDRLVAIGSIRMRARESGVETDVPSAAVVDYVDGLLWRYKDYGQARLALEAAGLG